MQKYHKASSAKKFFGVKDSVVKFFCTLAFFFCFFTFQFSNSKSEDQTPRIFSCNISDTEISRLLEQVRIGNKPQIRAMDDCRKSNRSLFAQIINLDPEYFQFASDYLKNDEVFISKFVTLNPKILKHISPRLKGDRFFMKKMTEIYPDALKYASPNLSDSRGFMLKMIDINPKNFAYCSYRLQNDKKVALLALKKSGKMLKFASDELQDNREIVVQAIKSYSLSISFASERLQKDPAIKKLSKQIDYSFIANFGRFLQENYGGLKVGPDGARGYHIVNMAKLFPEKQLSYQPYISKWEQIYKNGVETKDIKLTTINAIDGGWKVDFEEYPELIKEIENIFTINQVDQNTIDSLSAVSLWEVSTNPTVLAFNLYLLRNIENRYLDASASNVVSLTAIARQIGDEKKGKKWEININDAIYDTNLRMSLSYKSGHKRYKIWDIYQNGDDDKNPKILFKVEDKDGEYFDLFGKQLNNRYASIYKGGGYAMEINLFEDLNIVAN
ncbi:MAG: PIN domain nuclease of toxin-antitoxin system [Rickettsiales bacterium]|jgi:PIN domain nuclease of toxin-antitoxin system